MGIRTPCYTAMEEQHYVGKTGIRTPCYVTIKDQNYVGKMDIRTPCYTTMKEQNDVCFELLFQSSHSYLFAIV